jgi:hypothetical protein
LEPLRPGAGLKNHRIGQDVVVVDDSEETVLQAFFADAESTPAWVPLSYVELRRRTNLDRAPRILAAMREKYPVMKPAIDCPGKKGRGGLKVYLVKPPKNSRKSR